MAALAGTADSRGRMGPGSVVFQYPRTSVAIVVLFALFLRAAVSLYPHSGENHPPMFGDFEAQRHWMEVVWNLAPHEWYTNTTENDLLYWGLDYPPLTAFHHWAKAAVVQVWEPAAVELHTSRGCQTPRLKLFMRLSVLLSDVAVYMGASVALLLCCHPSTEHGFFALIVMLIQPGLILVDHGHFQYNCMALGLFVLAVICLLRRHDIAGSVFFCLALNYKQMSLYFAPAFLFYLLGKCVRQGWRRGMTTFLWLGLSVLVTFFLCWAPFVLSGRDVVFQVLHRLFPFSRHIYEDKVGNIWCILSVGIKWKDWFAISSLVRLCTLVTGLSLIPSSLCLLRHPSQRTFLCGLVACSLSFFLFSFQVHEKTILFPLQASLLLAPYHKRLVSWFVVVACFSMFPLLLKDELVSAYVATMAAYLIIRRVFVSGTSRWEMASLALMVGTHSAHLLFPAPSRYPDLHTLAYAAVSFLHFAIGWILAHYFQWQYARDTKQE